jgi:hypothetical protein
MSKAPTLDKPDFENILAGFLAGSDWNQYLHSLARPSGVVVTERAMKFLREGITRRLNEGHFGQAYNWSAMALLLGGQGVAWDPYFSDIYRPSRFQSKGQKKIEALLGRLDQLQIPGLAATLASWHNFSILYTKTRADAFALDRAILDEPLALHAILAMVDHRFAEPRVPRSTPPSSYDEFDSLELEEIAEAASYMFARRRFHRALSLSDFARFPPQGLPRLLSKAKLWLAQAHRLRKLETLECQVFLQQFGCVRSEAEFRAHPPSERFAMAMDFGYLRTQQMAASLEDPIGRRAASFREICQQFFDRFGRDLTPLRGDMSQRLRMELPQPMLEALGKDLLRPDSL